MNEDSNHRRAFEEFAEEAQDELGESLKKLILYGSVARGEETETSDVDVFAVVETGEQKKRLQKMGARIGVEHGLMMSTIVKTKEEYKEIENTSYGREVRETGEIHV